MKKTIAIGCSLIALAALGVGLISLCKFDDEFDFDKYFIYTE